MSKRLEEIESCSSIVPFIDPKNPDKKREIEGFMNSKRFDNEKCVDNKRDMFSELFEIPIKSSYIKEDDDMLIVTEATSEISSNNTKSFVRMGAMAVYTLFRFVVKIIKKKWYLNKWVAAVLNAPVFGKHGSCCTHPKMNLAEFYKFSLDILNERLAAVLKATVFGKHGSCCTHPKMNLEELYKFSLDKLNLHRHLNDEAVEKVRRNYLRVYSPDKIKKGNSRKLREDLARLERSYRFVRAYRIYIGMK